MIVLRRSFRRPLYLVGVLASLSVLLALGCMNGIMETVTFSLQNDLDTAVSVEYAIVCSWYGEQAAQSVTEEEGRLEVAPNTRAFLFTDTRDRYESREYRFAAVDPSGNEVCYWKFTEREVGRLRVLMVPSCSSDSVPTGHREPYQPGTVLPTRIGCSP